jgi:hypothetical protein
MSAPPITSALSHLQVPLFVVKTARPPPSHPATQIEPTPASS